MVVAVPLLLVGWLADWLAAWLHGDGKSKYGKVEREKKWKIGKQKRAPQRRNNKNNKSLSYGESACCVYCGSHENEEMRIFLFGKVINYCVICRMEIFLSFPSSAQFVCGSSSSSSSGDDDGIGRRKEESC